MMSFYPLSFEECRRISEIENTTISFISNVMAYTSLSSKKRSDFELIFAEKVIEFQKRSPKTRQKRFAFRSIHKKTSMKYKSLE